MTNFNSKSTLSKLLLIPLLNGNNIGSISIPSTGDWQTYTTVSNEVSLPAGTHRLRVFAQQPGWNLNWIEFNENEITTTSDCTNPQNIALGKATTQSSTLSNNNSQFGSANAVDGNNNGNHNANSMTHTNNQQNAWWEVDLGEVHDLSVVKLWNGTNCCADRLSNFYVLVSDVPFTSTGLNATINQNDVTEFYFPGTAGRETDINLNRSGRYLRVQLGGTNALQLAEVEVLGCDMPLATIKQHCNFGGNGVSLGIGEYPNMSGIGFNNDDLSSLQIPAGLQVTLFNNTNFGGSSITFTADDGCLANNNFNDKTSSLKIETLGVGSRSSSQALVLFPEFGPKTKVHWVFQQEEDKKVKQFRVLHGTSEEISLEEAGIVMADDNLGFGAFEFLHQDAQVGKNHYQIMVEYEDGSIFYPLCDDISFEVKPISLLVAPNPATDYLQVDVSKYLNQKLEYSIISMQGMVVADGQYQADHDRTLKVDLTELQNGLYIIRLKPEGNRAVTAKFMVAKDY